MKVMFDFKCQDCGEVYEGLIEPFEVDNVEATEKCEFCGGKLKRVWAFGYGKFNGTGFTKSTT